MISRTPVESTTPSHVILGFLETTFGVKGEDDDLMQDKLDAIFEPFVQLGRTRTSQHEGTGLGLAISRDLARAMGGDITIDSAVEEGSTMTLTLPRET